MPDHRTTRFARAVVRLRYAVIAFWLVAATAAVLLLPSLEEAQTGALGDLVPTNADAIDAEVRAAEQFGFPLLSRVLIVQRDAQGLSPAEQARVIERAIAITRGRATREDGVDPEIAGALPITNAVGQAPFVRERSTTALTYLFFRPDVSAGPRVRAAGNFARAIREREDHFVGVTGAIPGRAGQSVVTREALPLVELGTVLLVAFVLGWHFRALLAPLMTLIAVAIAYLISVRGTAAIGERAGISVPSEVEPVVIVLLLGIITDYAIFFLSRFRQWLRDGVAPRQAVERTVSDLQRIIVTAGLIVAFASASLVVAQLGFFQAFGPGLAIAVLIGLAVAMTFLPATLAVFGSAILWPGTAAGAPARAQAPPRSRAIALATSRPLPVAIGVTVLLLVLASGLALLDIGQTLIRGLPPDREPRTAYAAASAGFAPGILSPTVVLVEGEGITSKRAELLALQRRIAQRRTIAQVIGPAQQRTDRDLGAVYSPSGDAVRLLVITADDPLGAPAIRAIDSLQQALPTLLERSGLPDARAAVAGDTALAAETIAKAGDDLFRVAPATLILVFVMLSLFLRGWRAPLYLLGASLLGLAAALGVTVYVAELIGWGEITFFVPFAAAVLLVSLGSDYSVFLAGRIWAEARIRPAREAIAVGGAYAGSAITTAGVVLACSFALLALVPVRAFRELAICMSVGLLLDAFVVRTLLVPALMVLLGGVGHRKAQPEPATSVPGPLGSPGEPALDPVGGDRVGEPVGEDGEQDRRGGDVEGQ